MERPAKFTVLITIACLFVALSGCRRFGVVPQPATPQQQILGKWTMSTATTNSVFVNSAGINSKDTARFTSTDYFNFKADSTVAIMAGGVSYNGRWKIASNKLYFTGTNYVDIPVTGWDILTLTSSTLELGFSTSAPVVSVDYKLDFKR